MARGTAILVLTCLAIMGCLATVADDECPGEVPAVPSPTESGLNWGGASPVVTAEIASVKVECIPNPHPAVRRGSVERDAFTDFDIAATAWVQYAIKDATRFESMSGYTGLRAKLIFEAVSAQSVVLGSTHGTFQPITNGTSATVSAKITGLSKSEIHRVARVIARWAYGR